MEEGMGGWLHTCNPVYSQALDTSFSNACIDNNAVISSICIDPEDAPVCGGCAVVSKVNKARLNMEVQPVPHGVGDCKSTKKHKKILILESKNLVYNQYNITGLNIIMQKNIKPTYIHRQAPWPQSGRSCLCGSHGCSWW